MKNGRSDPCKHVKARLLQLRWGESARERAGASLGAYLHARGVAGTQEEILETAKAQLAAVESAATTFGGWKSFIPSLDFRASSSHPTFPYLVLQLLITDVH